ncbi:MAG: hypothetical protein IT198_13925 [Acidimicrobiia bacterium]|nr:hypothetical protein [Acidimicrobiia bacterium]
MIRVFGVVCAGLVSLPLLLYGFFVHDGVLQVTEPAGALRGADLAAEGIANWQDPPRGAGVAPFRWGVSEPMERRATVPLDLAKWRPVYEMLDPDLVRVFLWWDAVEPVPGRVAASSRPAQVMAFVEGGGWDAYGVFFQAPFWASEGGWTRRLGGARIWRYDPPHLYDDPRGPFAAYLELAAQQWPGLDVWQIWNEPDYPHGAQSAQHNPLVYRSWRGTATEYGRFVGTGAAKVREVAPAGLVATNVSNGPYSRTAYTVAGTDDIDLFDVHVASGKGRPNVDYALDRMIAIIARQKAAAEAAGAVAPRFSVSELSYPYTDAGAGDQADFVAKTHAVGAALGWDMLVWWEVGPSDPDYYVDTGIVASDGTPRPAGAAWMFSKATLAGMQPLGLRGDGHDVRIAVLAQPDAPAGGREVWVAWTVSGQGSVTWPLTSPPAAVHDATGTPAGTVQPGETVQLTRGARYFVPTT